MNYYRGTTYIIPQNAISKLSETKIYSDTFTAVVKTSKNNKGLPDYY